MRFIHLIMSSVLFCVICVSSISAQTSKPILKMLAILPLTGGSAEQGEWSRRGFELALEDLKAAGQNNLEIEYQDSRGDPKTAVDIYMQANSTHKVSVVFTWGSGVAMALSPLVNRDRVIQMGVATATPAYRSPGDFTFRVFHSALDEGEFIAQTLHSRLKVDQAAVFKLNNDYGVGIADAFKESFKKVGGSILREEDFQANDSDFRAQLTRIKSTNPSYIVLAAYPSEGAAILRQARQLALPSRFIASTAILGGTNFFKLGGESVEDLILVTWKANLPSWVSPAKTKLSEAYFARYKEDLGLLNSYVARAYDALHVVALAFQRCAKDDPICLRDQLFKVQNYDSTSGPLSFDECGDIHTEFALMQVKGQRFVPFER